MTLLTRRLRLVAGAAAVVVAGAAVLAIAIGTEASPSAAPRETTAVAEPTAAEPTTTEPTTPVPAADEPATVAPEVTAPEEPGQDPQPEGDAVPGPSGPETVEAHGSEPETEPETGAEIPPAPAEDPALDQALPESESEPPVLAGPAPETATAVGAVVAGFPAGIPIMGKSDVLTSDVAVEDQRVRVSLTATTPTSGADVLAEYDSALAANGFTAEDAPAVGGSVARAYSRGSESVTVTVTPTEAGGTGYSVLALLVAQE